MRLLKSVYWSCIKFIPFLSPVYLSRQTQTPIPLIKLLKFILWDRIRLYWPIHSSSVVVDAHRIHIGIETSPGLMPGCYIQGTNGIEIGDYTQIAAGVSMISSNHLLTDNRVHVAAPPIKIGAHSWIGTHAVILPGVSLGKYTIVGAGAVVTKSFEEGYQVLAGNPARIIKELDPSECVVHESQHKYHGFLSPDKFFSYQEKRLESISWQNQ